MFSSFCFPLREFDAEGRAEFMNSNGRPLYRLSQTPPKRRRSEKSFLLAERKAAAASAICHSGFGIIWLL